VTWRVLLEGGPLDGQQAAFERANLPLGDAQVDWPPAFDHADPPGRYVLASQEPVPFGIGESSHVMLTARYAWEAT
jgi:hypothetical protein